MGLLEASFPYPVLLTFLKVPTLNSNIKAAACRMVRCLYVDREPQLVIKYPRLVKTTSSCAKPDESDSESNSDEGSDYETSNKTEKMSPEFYKFGVLQIIISEYLQNELDATRCDDMSSEMMETLLDLMKFGFYDSTEQLQNVISPLVQALDDHFMNRGKDQNKMNSKKKSSILLLQATVGSARRSLFDKTDKSKEKSVQSSADPDDAAVARTSNRVNVNFRHSRRTLNEAMHISLSNQAKGHVDSAADASRKSLLKSSSQEKKSLLDVDVNKTQFELSLLRRLESLPALIFILVVVIFAAIFSTVQILTKQDQNQSTYIFELSIASLFFFELTVRSYCYLSVYKELSSFISEPLNVLDILLVAFDICLIAFDSSVLGSADGATSYAKTLR
jgi:hypothetical protein